ncbi:anthranilate synthase component I [Blastopirellula marina]|uniref:Anthranilate synthase component 1 n=1 Tax=Blastopirellula marina TaxID=124 RepID=A0A2S8F233_9BACT|nr:MULTISPECIES: anthranilate synthase component I [Pirellulaceae]PQO26209.1 anthranilate synthase component I [Blastopirellula marina]RCS44568.1 anthranilate synthase component I [Bremerella cremea]
MPYLPEFSEFEKLAEKFEIIPVYRRLISDSMTPVSAFHKLDDGKPACLFESVVGGEKVGRYSFIGIHPEYHLSATRDQVTITSNEGTETFTSANPLEELRKRLDTGNVAHIEGLPPFNGGAIGYAGYDVVRYVENLPNAPQDDRHLPDLSFGFYNNLVVFDNVTKTAYVIVMAKCPQGKPNDHQAIYNAACQQAEEIVAQLTKHDPTLTPTDIDLAGYPTIAYRSNFTQEDFEAAVRKCVEYIVAGDIFQVVFSQRLEVDIQSDPFEIYRTLRIVNPSPFMFFLRTPETTLVGSSPEIMVRVMDGTVTVRPLAGTRPRGLTEAEDAHLAEELLADPKERAEHVMLVDLGRNDVGRVAKYRSVQLSDVMAIERYSHVMHITSNVTGELPEGKDAFDAMAACLPAGTVSGAPKVRAMEIIDEIEPNRRGPYAGAVGYIDYGGNMDTCIALRTIVIQDGIAYVQAGAGIVADSDPKMEYQETLNKARGILKAIEITEKRSAAQKNSK